jgi:subtilisin family serine protease
MKRSGDVGDLSATSFAATRRAPLAEALESRVLLSGTNDPMFESQYALASAGVPAAWETTRGSAAVIVADLDTGVDYTHPDLYLNVWINQAEIPPALKPKLVDTDGDGRITFYDLNDPANAPLTNDANGNGYIDAGDLLRPVDEGGWEDGVNGRSGPADVYTDDIVGWDFAEDDNNPFDDAGTGAGHGTHTAGVLGAAGDNGVGISGVAQKVSMMLVRLFDDAGVSAPPARIAAAIRYTADNGSRVANASWGVSEGRNGDVVYKAIAYAGQKGELLVAAAGNNGWDLDSRLQNNYPAEYNLPNIVAVGATTREGGRAGFSNYGASAVDLAAPGAAILSTLPGGRYGTLSGTSMAAPLVSGTAALMLSANPSLTVAQLRQRLLRGADRSGDLSNFTVSDGKLNAANAVLSQKGAKFTGPVSAAAKPAPVRMADALRLTLTRTGFFSVRAILASSK